jgi:tol-pal system protein YbgF
MIPTPRHRTGLSILPLASAMVCALALSLPAPSASAQQGPPTRPQGTGKGVPAAAPASGESGLARRVEQLEEQLVDMQVMVGTLESLARGVTAPAGGNRAGGAIGGADAGRLDSIETQIRALAAQLEQLQEQVRAMGGRSGAIAPSSGQASAEPPPPAGGPRPGRPAAGPPAQPERAGFGSTTVSPDDPDDEINKLLGDPSLPSGSQPMRGPGPRVAAAAPTDPDVTPKQLYETAYGYLLQRDYGAAEAAFDDFLRRHPSDPLAANAQYWLGESLYVRGQYRAAAGAFLKGYQNYARSPKAPEALLKLAMSLQRLGQKDAACTSFNELGTKFPNAPTHVKSAATAERQRAGCT